MTDIIVSAHGGRWNDQRQNLTVPTGCSVVFYVADGATLYNDDGYRILDALQHQRSVTAVERVDAGSNTYDYSCWYAPDFAAHCGIFDGSTLEKGIPCVHAPLLLSAIFRIYPSRTIHWVACRNASARSAHAGLLAVSPGSHLTAPVRLPKS